MVNLTTAEKEIRSYNQALLERGLTFPSQKTAFEKKAFVEKHLKALQRKKPLECCGKGHWMFPDKCHRAAFLL